MNVAFGDPAVKAAKRAKAKANKEKKVHKGKLKPMTSMLFDKFFHRITGKKPVKTKVAKSSVPSTSPHWKALLTGGDAKLLDLAKAPGSRITIDDFNGCYRLYYAGKRHRSISWTLRGRPLAIQSILEESWDVHYNHSGHKCPYPSFFKTVAVGSS